MSSKDCKSFEIILNPNFEFIDTTEEVMDEDWCEPLHEIERHLYLGGSSAAFHKENKFVQELTITTILSVICGKVSKSRQLKGITYHHIDADDDESQDLLTYFPQTYEWIDNCINSGQNILVHCMAGISRSAAVVIAYIMQKYRITVSEAMNIVKAKRIRIAPNPGFVRQLDLFEKMGYTLNANNRQLREHLLQSYSKVVYNENHLHKYFERLSVMEEMTPILDLGLQYDCSKCGQKLFNEINVIKNDDQMYRSDAKPDCNRFYVEPQEWMHEMYVPLDPMLFYGFTKCKACGEDKARFDVFLQKLYCNCIKHLNNKCLIVQMLNKSFSIHN